MTHNEELLEAIGARLESELRERQASADTGHQVKLTLKRSLAGRRPTVQITIREREGNRGQYTGRLLRPNEGNLGHVEPGSRGGQDAWENLVSVKHSHRQPEALMWRLGSFGDRGRSLPVSSRRARQ